mgnify:CR=1 FL=1
MLSKINICPILREHIRTFKSDGGSESSTGDVIVFVGVPIALSFVIFKFSHADFLSESILNSLITVFSILVGLLLNLLLLIMTVVQKEEEKLSDRQIKNRINLLSQLYANISYAILASLAVVCFSVIAFSGYHMIRLISSFVIVGVTIHVCLTVLMIIKRIYSLLHP